MRRPLLAFVGLIAAGGTAAGVYVALPGGGEEEVLQQPTTATANPSASETPVATVVKSPTPSAAAIPDDWKAYSDDALGFSLWYPADLEFKDLTAPSGADGLNQRVVEFRSPKDPARAIAVSISANPKDLTLKEWAIRFAACAPDTIAEAIVAGESAVSCMADALIAGPAVVIGHANSVYYISTTGVGQAEFAQFLASIRL